MNSVTAAQQEFFLNVTGRTYQNEHPLLKPKGALTWKLVLIVAAGLMKLSSERRKPFSTACSNQHKL
jgi:hypothetical protein